MIERENPRRAYRFGPFRLDAAARLVFREDEIVPLPPKAVDTLLVLVQHAGRPVQKEALIHAVWPETFVEENNLAHHVSVLRKTLDEATAGTSCIETIPKYGYRFVGQIKEEAIDAGGLPERPPVELPAPANRPHASRRKLAVASAFVLLGSVTAVWWLGRSPRGPLFDSLAVLPFQNLSGDPSQEFISDGLTESLTAELAKIRALRVISRTSVMLYKNGRKPLPQIARELSAQALIEGSVARFGARARISVQLLDGANDKHLWAETYERDLAEIPKLWGEVAMAVAREIRARVDPERRARLTSRPVRREAFEAYLRGRYYWNKRTAENIHKAVGFFRNAIDEDPAYAVAYGGLADCYNQLGTVFIGSQPPSEIRPLAIAAARHALEIDPELAEAHAALAYARLYDWEWAAAENGFQHAIQLNPNYASAHLWYSHLLSCRRRFDEALREVRLAHQLDPLSPIIQTQIGWALDHAGRHDEAIGEYRKVLATDPDYLWALWRIGSSYAAKSMFPEAIGALERAAAHSGRSPSILGTLAETYGLAGRKAEARKVLDELTALERLRYVPAIAFAHAYIGLGENELILQSLERAHQRRENGVAYLALRQDHGGYQSDPRFRKLLRQVGLASQ